MLDRITAALGGAVVIAAGALVASSPAQAQAQAPSRVVGHEYVDDNTAGPNTVAGFDRHADGTLTPMTGSPFEIGGQGLGAGLGSQGAIQASADHRFVLAVDAGSNEISVLRVRPDGSLHLIHRPVSSGGVEPVSIAVDADGLVYVANVGAGGSNYAAFQLSDTGNLVALPYATYPVPEGSGVGDVFFNSTGTRLVGTRDNTSLIDSFVVRFDGVLTPAPGAPFPAQDLGPIGSQFRPTNPGQLYVSNAHAGAGKGTVSAFRDGHDGALYPIGDSPVADGQTAPCWVEISHDGRFLFAVNTASSNISSYAIAKDGSLTLLGTAAMRNGMGAVDARLSPDGSTLSVTGSSSRVVSTFAVHGGTLTELAGSPVALPDGTAPMGLVVL